MEDFHRSSKVFRCSGATDLSHVQVTKMGVYVCLLVHVHIYVQSGGREKQVRAGDI